MLLNPGLILLAYLLGSIPFGVLVSSIWNMDVRLHGSGNTGATNVWRTLGPGPGATVFILDFLKGYFAVYLAIVYLKDPLFIILAGTAAILGHMYSVFIKFKGGKGAATGLGVLFGVAPDLFIAVFVVALLLIVITRYVSVATLLCTVLMTGLMFYLKKPLPYALAALIMTIFIWLKHIPNIQRLLQGEENKI